VTSLYKPNPAGMRALGQSPGVGQAMVRAAERGKWAAERSARAYSRSGQYAGSFRVRQTDVIAGRSNERRAGAVLENVAPHGTANEFEGRTRRRTGRHHLERAIPLIERGSW